MPRIELSKTYEPGSVESKWYAWWEDSGSFKTDPKSDKDAFVINMPPPNVTGQLHMGHGLQDSVQDAFIRYKRMKGFDSLWQPGKDHAGIATQNVVEKMLAKDGITRHSLGREAFVEKVWEWCDKYGGIITNQKRKLGDSADWQHETFTMDPAPSSAVREVFVRLYEKDLIYQGFYIVNWCPRCHTAISDEEVDHYDKASHMWHMAYPISNDDGSPGKEKIVVATTRPETMLGDVAVAVHPEDERYNHLIGKKLCLPLTERKIIVIADDFVDPEFGTGCVKVTPAHDPNDFDMGRRHNLEPIIVLDIDGKINENGGKYNGQDRYLARENVLADLDSLGLLVKIDDHQHSVGQCNRCDTVIEPYLSKQWFVRMEGMAAKALKAVENGEIAFHPTRWTKVFDRWMNNIRDWCISRQLWWGHRIPVFYCDDCDELMVIREDPTACTKCGGKNIRQDEDVLDTWFSSWLWPFTTLGWPNLDDERYKKYYPTDLMVTGYDIIFFWVSRMIMGGLEFTGQAPFKDVYMTGMVKDELGRKMSKSLDNGIDPLKMVDQYGADAVRYSMIALNTEGQDIKLSEQKFEMGRNFANKIWQAFKFLHMQDWELLGSEHVISKPVISELADEWILSRLHSTIKKVDDSFDRFKPNEGLAAIHEFIWGDFCDWYIELIKDRLYDKENPQGQRQTLAHALHIFTVSMQTLSPFMPFLTEEIWSHIRTGLSETGATQHWDDSLMNHDYPTLNPDLISDIINKEFTLVQSVVTALRNIRAEQGISPKKSISCVILGEKKNLAVLEPVLNYVSSLAVVEKIDLGGERPQPVASNVVEGMDILVPLAGLIDFDAERKRLEKEKNRIAGQVKGLSAKLNNENFTKRAPDDVVARERKKLADAELSFEKIQHNIDQLN
jgi:valyl-tRNA synthetase